MKLANSSNFVQQNAVLLAINLSACLALKSHKTKSKIEFIGIIAIDLFSFNLIIIIIIYGR